MMIAPAILVAESAATNGVPPIWVAVIGAIVSMATLGAKYLSDKHKSDADVQISKHSATERDKKIKLLAEKLEEANKRLQEARQSETKLRTNLGVLSIKLNTITGVVKELAPDRPEIIRIVDKIENSNAGI